MPLRVAVTEGARADCKEARAFIEGLSAEALLADRGYDSNEITGKVVESGCQPVIPPKKNRKEQRDYDKAPYRVRHLIENAFLHLKRWRGIVKPPLLVQLKTGGLGMFEGKLLWREVTQGFMGSLLVILLHPCVHDRTNLTQSAENIEV